MHRDNTGFDLNTLIIFRRVIELESLSKTAEELGINASTVSRKIVELETFYGVKLLHRTTRALTLTEEGRTFYNYCQSIGDLLQRSENEIMHTQSEPTGTLKVVAPVDFGNLALQKLLTQFAKKYPKVSLDLEFSNRVVDMAEEDVDVWFSIGEVSNQSLIAVKLLGFRRYLMASKDYLAAYGDIKSLKDVKVPHKKIRTRAPFTFEETEKNVLSALPVSFAVNSSYTAFQACVDGLGLAFINPFFAEKYDKESQLVTLLKEEVYQETDVYLVYKARKLKPMRVAFFIDYTKNHFQ